CAACGLIWGGGSTCESTILPTWGRTCISCSARGAATPSKTSCGRSRASWLGGSWGEKGPAQAGPSSAAWPGRESSVGVAITWACGTMSFEIKSKEQRGPAFVRRSNRARHERRIAPDDRRREHLRAREVLLSPPLRHDSNGVPVRKSPIQNPGVPGALAVFFSG